VRWKNLVLQRPRRDRCQRFLLEVQCVPVQDKVLIFWRRSVKILLHGRTRTHSRLAIGPTGCVFLVVAETVHDRGVFGEDHTCRWGLKCSVVLFGHVCVCEVRSLRRSRVHVGASSEGAQSGVGLRTGLAFQNFKARSMALIAYDR